MTKMGGGAVVVHVLGNVDWMREITSFMDGLPGLILAFQRQRHAHSDIAGINLQQVVHDAVVAEDLRVLAMLDRLVTQQHAYADTFSFGSAMLYACYCGCYTSLRWLDERRWHRNATHEDLPRVPISEQDARDLHDFLGVHLNKTQVSSSRFEVAPALTTAVRQNRPDIVRLLLDFGWPERLCVASALRIAAAYGYFEIVQLLVAKGEWRSLLDAVTQALYYGHTEIVEYLKHTACRERERESETQIEKKPSCSNDTQDYRSECGKWN